METRTFFRKLLRVLFPQTQAQASFPSTELYPQPVYAPTIKLGPHIYYYCFSEKEKTPGTSPSLNAVPHTSHHGCAFPNVYLAYHLWEPRWHPTAPQTCHVCLCVTQLHRVHPNQCVLINVCSSLNSVSAISSISDMLIVMYKFVVNEVRYIKHLTHGKGHRTRPQFEVWPVLLNAIEISPAPE